MNDDIIIRKVEPKDKEQYINLLNSVWKDSYKHIFPKEVFIERENNASNQIKNFSNVFYNEIDKLLTKGLN